MSEETTYYLEMKSAAELNSKSDSHGLEVRECEIKQYAFNRFLYQFIGGPWEWTDKLSWTEEEWQAFAESDTLRTWVAYVQGSPAGYYELRRDNEGDVEILYFGLAPKFIGKGFGGYFLSHGITSAWNWEGTRRVWVHTCNLDHPSALQNYKSRGMQIYREETSQTS